MQEEIEETTDDEKKNIGSATYRSRSSRNSSNFNNAVEEIERSNVDTRDDRVAAARDTLVTGLRNRAYSVAYRGTLEVAGTLLRAVIIDGSRNDLTPGLVKQTLPERRTDTTLRRSLALHHAIALIVALLLSTLALRIDFW